MYPKLIEFNPFKLPEFLGLDPISYIPTYGVILAVGFLLALKLAVSLSKRDGFPPGRIVDLSIYCLIIAILGAKLLLIFYDFDQYLANPREILSTLRLAGVFYGGFIASLVFMFLYCRWHGMNVLQLLDNFAPAVILGQAVGRWGCFSAGCCYGTETDLPWGVVFTNEFSHKTVGVPLHTPLHPTQIYESVGNFVILLVLLFLWKHRKFYGEIIASYIILYPISRFFWEFFRGDTERKIIFESVTRAQIISLVLAGFGVVFYFYLRLRRGRNGEGDERGASRHEGEGDTPRD